MTDDMQDPSDALLDILRDVMTNASGELRAEIVKAGRRVLPSEMRRARRDRLVRRCRSRFYTGASDRQAAAWIADDLAARSGVFVHSLRSEAKDQLIDEILLIASPPSAETIRSEILK